MARGWGFHAKTPRRAALPFFSGVLLGVLLLLSTMGLTSVLAASPQVVVGGGGNCWAYMDYIHNSTSVYGDVSIHSLAQCNNPVEQIRDTTTLYVQQWYGLEYLNANSKTYSNSALVKVVVHAGCPSSNGETYRAYETASFTDSGQTSYAYYERSAYLACS